MTAQPLVSILINNFNYARFLPQAIESALGQTYPRVEVLIVDDGSTDGSRAVIERYGTRVTPLYKANGGQASTFNLGFAHARGDIVLFLDADDQLLPDLVQRVVTRFEEAPTLAKVHFRMAVVDAAGHLTGTHKPAAHLPLPNGDLRTRVLACFDDMAWQSTSGNAFPRWVLERIFPVPEEIFPRTGADYYLSNLPTLFGPVASVDGIGTLFRIHGGNNHHTSRLSLDRSREIIRRVYRTQACIHATARSLGLPGAEAAANPRGVRFLAHRMASLKLEPQHHPVAGDRVGVLAAQGILAARRRSDLRAPLRGVYLLWFLAMVIAPRRAAWWLAERFFYPETRPTARLPRRVRRTATPLKEGAQP